MSCCVEVAFSEMGWGPESDAPPSKLTGLSIDGMEQRQGLRYTSGCKLRDPLTLQAERETRVCFVRDEAREWNLALRRE